MSGVICFAHRGASGHEPENTLIAMEKAISMGVDWIELDVRVVDDELIVIHDDRLERTTNGAGCVHEHSLEYLRSLDAGKGQRIPLLRETFDLINKRAGLNIELKGTGTAGPTVELIRHYIRNRGWKYDEFIVSSFDHHALVTVKQIDPAVRTGALVVGIPLGYARFAQELKADSVHCSLDFINDAFVHDAHARGLNVYVFTINNREDLDRVVTMGVDGVFTNFPEIVVTVDGNDTSPRVTKGLRQQEP
ncbi:MAG TPA: glycerophosphodiester phosphodiesterase [Deltaproteobacteria bacterium]|nr:glycerophosphodiester phosphodiesterase [Deltaproteobacteria bacterium]